MSDTERSNEFGFSVVTARPTLRERQLALAVVGTILIGFAIVAPFANTPLSRLDSFIPSIQIMISITSVITAVLLFGQFSTLGSCGLLVLAGGYLFIALIVVSHSLTFPGAFSTTGLFGAGVQSAGWLYFFWHFGFPIAVIGYVSLKHASLVGYSAGRAIVWTVATVIGLVCVLTWIVTAKEHLLPVLFIDGASFSAFTSYATGTDLFLSALALALLWKRGLSILAMWLSVTLCAFLAELLINTVLISSRFTLGWYFGRASSILVPTIVMILMLAQSFALNTRLMHVTMMLHRERSNRLANLDAVIASIAHEVRQPLAGIAMRGAAAKRYLGRTPPSLREAGTAVDAMVEASMRANDIFKNIRALFSNVGQQHMQTIDVNQLAAEALDLLREDVNAFGVETSLQLTQEIPPIIGHKGQLREVILNLIQNAIDAMKAVSDRRRVLRIRTDRHDNEAIIISVEDTGTGIPREKTKKIFDPFFSTKAKGMGLGLAICKSIVERHQGELSASSEIGSGARFQLILPIKPKTQQELPNKFEDMIQMPIS
jgi:signal transduction histidine kinase